MITDQDTSVIIGQDTSVIIDQKIVRIHPPISVQPDADRAKKNTLYLRAQELFLCKIKFCYQLLPMNCPELDF